jgi:hypothetical protein
VGAVLKIAAALLSGFVVSSGLLFVYTGARSLIDLRGDLLLGLPLHPLAQPTVDRSVLLFL